MRVLGSAGGRQSSLGLPTVASRSGRAGVAHFHRSLNDEWIYGWALEIHICIVYVVLNDAISTSCPAQVQNVVFSPKPETHPNLHSSSKSSTLGNDIGLNLITTVSKSNNGRFSTRKLSPRACYWAWRTYQTRFSFSINRGPQSEISKSEPRDLPSGQCQIKPACAMSIFLHVGRPKYRPSPSSLLCKLINSAFSWRGRIANAGVVDEPIMTLKKRLSLLSSSSLSLRLTKWASWGKMLNNVQKPTFLCLNAELYAPFGRLLEQTSVTEELQKLSF